MNMDNLTCVRYLRAEQRYLSVLLTCQIDNLCGQRIMSQLQHDPLCALGENMDDMFLLPDIAGEVCP